MKTCHTIQALHEYEDSAQDYCHIRGYYRGPPRHFQSTKVNSTPMDVIKCTSGIDFDF